MSPPTPQIGIVIPAHNEAGYIEATLQSLAGQADVGGPEQLKIVVVENGSSDETRAVVEACAQASRTSIKLLDQDEASMVTSRALGFAHLLSEAAPPPYLVSADADTLFPRCWLRTALARMRDGADVVSSAGYMSPELWARCPRLTQRYLHEIGTIFFDPATIDWLGVRGEPFLFTEEVFRDFGRPVSDAGFAITSECYRRVGGFQRHRYADGTEMAAVGWPFLIQADLLRMRTEYMGQPYWSTSPRRLLQEPAALFDTSAYRGAITAFRTEDHDEYRVLDRMAADLALRPLQEYCLKYYVLQRCVSRPELLRQNDRYFGPLLPEVEQSILSLHSARMDAGPGGTFAFLDQMSEQYGGRLLDQIKSLRLRA